MTPPTGYLDDHRAADGWALHYPKARIEAERANDVPGGNDVCSFPTCGVADKLLRVALRRAGVDAEDLDRVTVTSACDVGSYPAIGSVRVDDHEVYRVAREAGEVFDPEVVSDVLRALRRAA